MRVATVILAAGQGTRMKSETAKVLHPVGGKPMVVRALETAERLSEGKGQPPALPILIIGRDADSVRSLVGERARCVVQPELLGTGHAVMQAETALRGEADVVVVYYADMPLLRPETIQRVIEAQKSNAGPVSMLTVIQEDPRNFGRILRDKNGSVAGIVEERECTPEQLKIREVNPGVYAFRADWLWQNLPKLTPKSKGEYYLTDMVDLAAAQGQPVIGLPAEDADETIGVNTRVHLSEAEAALRKRLTRYWMLEGVTILDPATTTLSEEATIGQDTVIYPNTQILGRVSIGANCFIGPNSVIRESQIGPNCTVDYSVVEEATMEAGVHIGPFAHLRPGAYLEEGVHMGNFGEVKNSRLGRGTRMAHFTYVGDAEVGQDVNLGAGIVTVNFDGKRKHKTIIGDHAFVGSDTMLVAPVQVGANAATAAGAVVTKPVPEGHIAIGVPARMQVRRTDDAQ